MSNPHNKFNSVSKKSNFTKQNEVRNQFKEDKIPNMAETNINNVCGDSIRRLESLRLKKQSLQRSAAAPQVMNVWERLNKSKRAVSPSGRVVGNPYRHQMCVQTTSPFKKPRNLAAVYSPQRRPQAKQILDNHHKQSQEPAVFNGLMTELVASRRLRDSNSSFEDLDLEAGGKQLLDIDNSNLDTSDDDLNEVFESATVFPTRSKESITCSARIALDFRSALANRRCFMAPDEISVVKNIIKSDERLKVKRTNDKVFVDVLHTKLNEIKQQENLLRFALQNLSHKNQRELLCNYETSVHHQTALQRNPQVHVIFKDLPQMQRESAIYNALKQNLTKTVNKNLPENSITKKSACTMTRDVKKITKIAYVLGYKQNAICRVRAKGVRLEIEYVREFSISRKTISELKNDKRLFYVPVSDTSNQLKRTNFKRLKGDPRLLMSFMQPKNNKRFNVLEQDSIFFNSFFYKSFCGTSSSKDMSDDDDQIELFSTEQKNALKTKKDELDIGDTSTNRRTVQMKTFEEKSEVLRTNLTQQDNRYGHLRKCITQNKIQPNRRRIRQQITPLPERKSICPKNRLIPIVLVAAVEFLSFLVILLSYFYPEIAC